ncbi:GumC family protein [Lacinutrix undariae]
MITPQDITSYTSDTDEALDIKQEIFKYLRYWPWFAVTLVISLLAAYMYLRYTPQIYETSAKMKVLDESEGLELPSAGFLLNRSSINLENETEILKSYLILEQVTRNLKLNTTFYVEGNVRTSQIDKLPFYFEQLIAADSIQEAVDYDIFVHEGGFDIFNHLTETTSTITLSDLEKSPSGLPFIIKANDVMSLDDLVSSHYIVKFRPFKSTVLGLKGRLNVSAVGKQSHLLEASIKGESRELSEKILNELMVVFNNDGINDRQLVSKRTLSFIDDRFVFLAKELDSIEVDRKEFKQDNNLVDLVADSQLGLEQRSTSDAEVFRVNNQVALAQLLQQSLAESATGNGDLLPSNIGLENGGINALVADYNTAVIARDKLASSGGVNNPSVVFAQREVAGLKSNITRSLSSYLTQLEVSRQQVQQRNNRFVGQVSQIPLKEKLLRSIERQQKIKESLYLLLLQKREEAAINLAITEPSIKVVEYALSGIYPVSPKSKIVYAGALLLGLLLPFGFLYVIFMLDTKLHGKEDVLKFNSKIPVIGEIPNHNVKKFGNFMFSDPNDRTPAAEAFRILASNVNYILPLETPHDGGSVIYTTSTIKGEGKTYISLNLSLSLASLNKKVLLVGTDLRNPQIHTHINRPKTSTGLSDYLYDTSAHWQDALIKGFDKQPKHDILLSGNIPPNPAHLLTNGRFEQFLKEARLAYDYIVVDTAPTLLVTDTLLISKFADTTIFVTRANYTDTKLLGFSKDLVASGKLKNLAYVVNGVDEKNSYGYGYNYGYGYGYGSD